VVNVNPHVFAYLVAIGETAVAIGLIFGLFSNLTNISGLLLSVVIWATAEGFGGPYAPGSTDIGSAIIYALVFVGLFLASAGLYYGLDRFLDPILFVSKMSRNRCPIDISLLVLKQAKLCYTGENKTRKKKRGSVMAEPAREDEALLIIRSQKGDVTMRSISWCCIISKSSLT
jgi:DoxX